MTTPARAAGTGLETFVLVTNGQSNYSTYRQPDAVFFNFGGFGSGIPSDADSDPSFPAGDGISGTYRVTDSASAGVLTDALSTAGSGLSTFGSWSYSGSTGVTDFNIASGSGTFYDASGVRLSGAASAPEPCTLALLTFALPLAGMARNRRKSRKPHV